MSTTVTYDLSQLSVGTHSITVKATATGFPDSEASQVITYTIYSITKNLTGCSVSGTNPVKIGQDTSVSIVFVANNGWVLPDNVTISGSVTSSWVKSTGTLTLSNPSTNVNITITAIQQLPAPTITMSGGVISFDPIAGADTYQVFAGNTSIGEVSA